MALLRGCMPVQAVLRNAWHLNFESHEAAQINSQSSKHSSLQPPCPILPCDDNHCCIERALRAESEWEILHFVVHIERYLHLYFSFGIAFRHDVYSAMLKRSWTSWDIRENEAFQSLHSMLVHRLLGDDQFSHMLPYITDRVLFWSRSITRVPKTPGSGGGVCDSNNSWQYQLTTDYTGDLSEVQ